MEGTLSIGKKKYFFVLQGNVVSWATKKGAKKNDGECSIKAGSTVEAVEGGFKFGPDSSGNMVEVSCEKDEAEQWTKALSALADSEGDAPQAEGDLFRAGWLIRDKKKFFFTVRGGYLTWYHKEPNPSIPHNKNFVKELTLNSATVAAGAAAGSIDLVKTTKTEKKSEEKTYSLTAADAADAKLWIEALQKGIASADEAGLGTGERTKAGLGARMKKGMAQKIATSKGGKSAAKKVLSPEVMGLLAALRQTVELYAGKQQAEDLENSMIRIITKLYFAVDTRQVPLRDLMPADKHLRQALKYISLVWGGRFRNALTRGQPPAERDALNKVTENMNAVENILLKSLGNVLQPKNIALIRSTLAFLKDHKYLTFVVEDQRLEQARMDLEQAMDQYTSVELDFASIEARLGESEK